jgi:hypothetical protein
MGEVADHACRVAVGADAKRVRSLDLKEISKAT